MDSTWTMKYYFYTSKNPTGRRASVHEFITRQTCTICDYTVDYMCRTKTSKSPHAFISFLLYKSLSFYIIILSIYLVCTFIDFFTNGYLYTIELRKRGCLFSFSNSYEFVWYRVCINEYMQSSIHGWQKIKT